MMAIERVSEETLREYEQIAQAPALLGTERQVAWARQIRHDWAAAYNIYCVWQGPDAAKPERAAYPDADPQVDVAVHRWVIDHQVEASWWIDHRDQDTAYGRGIYDLYHRTAPASIQMARL
jgi:hypothetical protein